MIDTFYSHPWLYSFLFIFIVNVVMGLLKFPVMKRPYGITFELGIKKSWMPYIYLGPIKLGEIRPCYKVNGNWRQCENGGIKLDLSIGTVRGPMPKLFTMLYLRIKKVGRVEWETNTNRWNTNNRYLTYTLPYFPSILISVLDFTGIGFVFLIASAVLYLKHIIFWKIISFIGLVITALAVMIKSADIQPGFYVGFKTYYVNRISSQLKSVYMPDGNDLFGFEEGDSIHYNRTDWTPIYTWATKEEQGNSYLILTIAGRGDIVDNQISS